MEKLSNYEIMAAIIEDNAAQYQDRIPQLTRDNIEAVGNAILGSSYDGDKNVFINELINKIGLTKLSRCEISNPFEKFRGEEIPYGEALEDIYVDVVKSEDNTKIYDDDAENNPYKIFKPNVKANYHVFDDERNYPVTIYDRKLRLAFKTPNGLDELINAIVAVLNDSRSLDAYIVGKHMLSADKIYGLADQTVEITKSNNDDVEVGAMYNAIRQGIAAMTQPSTKLNAQGATRMCRKDGLSLIVRADYKLLFDNYLKGVYNLSLVDLGVDIIEIDSFDTADHVASLIENSGYKYHEGYRATTAQRNERRDYWNYFGKIRQLQSYSLFKNAMRFVLKDGAVTATGEDEVVEA